MQLSKQNSTFYSVLRLSKNGVYIFKLWKCKKRIIIAECDTIARLGLKTLCKEILPTSTIHEVSTLIELYQSLKKQKFDLLILALLLRDKNTLSSFGELYHLQPKVNILVVSNASEKIYCERVLREGAKGFINKMAENDSFRMAISRVSNGDYYFSKEYYIETISQGKNKNIFSILSNKEMEIVYYLLKRHVNNGDKRTRTSGHKYSKHPQDADFQ